jgi:hypothetical protein
MCKHLLMLVLMFVVFQVLKFKCRTSLITASEECGPIDSWFVLRRALSCPAVHQ